MFNIQIDRLVINRSIFHSILVYILPLGYFIFIEQEKRTRRRYV